MANWNNGIERLQNTHVLVLGAARSGISAAHLLLKLGATVVLNDRNKPKDDETWVEDLQAKGAELILGEHPEGLLARGFDLIVKNPGIPYRHTYLQQATKLGIPIVTEVELGYLIAEGLLIGITGSNGKTTTTTLVGEFFTHAGRDAIVAGNIGHVFSEQVQHSHAESVIIAELSSFQLKGTQQFRPQIACILNIYPHHLDYHESYEDYVASKRRLLDNQRSTDIAVMNWDQDQVRRIGLETATQVYWFSVNEPVDRGAFISTIARNGAYEDWIVFRQVDMTDEAIIRVADIVLVGKHNLENILAGIIIAKLGGVSTEAIATVLQQFRGVEHRLEFVANVHGVRYYNDSKATNPEATEKAMQSFHEPLILIAGGMERGEALDALIPLLHDRVHTLITYGQTKERLYEIGKAAGVPTVVMVTDIPEAVQAAAKHAQEGDVVLLSPACASWDLYASFEERGRMFKEAVHTL